jgi:chromosome segregation ATPase
MQSDFVGKALQHEAFIEAILRAVTSSLEARDALSVRYETLLAQVGLVTLSQLEEMRDELETFKQEAEGLREQLDFAAQTTRKLRQRAENAEDSYTQILRELEELKETIKSANEESIDVSSGDSITTGTPEWRPTMTKAELRNIASTLGLKVSTKLKKSDLIERLKSFNTH